MVCSPAVFHPDRVSDEMLASEAPVVWALAGGGCSPRIFDGCIVPGVHWLPIDWTLAPGPYDPESVAAWLGAALARRRGPTVLAGHSLGAFDALLAAIRHPDRVHALILSNTGARIEGHGDPDLPRRVRESWDASVQADYLRACFLHEPPAALWRQCLEFLAALRAQTLLQGVEGLRRLDLSGELDRVRCPVLVAHGELDRRRPLASATLLASGIRDARLKLLPGGHTPMVDCPAEYQRAVRDFLAEIGLAAPFHLEETR
jgi:pimeloyl-ACP methyl ester carboxylesterase